MERAEVPLQLIGFVGSERGNVALLLRRRQHEPSALRSSVGRFFAEAARDGKRKMR
jgi:hypothetical protein